jgi:hypothetical protein
MISLTRCFSRSGEPQQPSVNRQIVLIDREFENAEPVADGDIRVVQSEQAEPTLGNSISAEEIAEEGEHPFSVLLRLALLRVTNHLFARSVVGRSGHRSNRVCYHRMRTA